MSFLSLRKAIELLIIINHRSGGDFAIRVESWGLRNTLAAIESHWQEISSYHTFEFQFLDETMQMHYRQEERESQLYGIFAFIAVAIACLGLFGVAAFNTELMRHVFMKRSTKS